MRACQLKDLKGREWRSLWERERKREKEKEKEHTHVGEKERESTRTRERRERERASTYKGEKERVLWLLLLYIFASTWACPMQIGLSQECCSFYLKSSLWSSDLPVTFLVF